MFYKGGSFKFIKKVNNNKGTAAVEFALIAPVFFIILMGIFEVGMLMLIQTALETAVLQVSRYGRTGSTVAGQTTAQIALGLASTYSFGFAPPDQMQLTVIPYSSFSAIPPLSQVQITGTQNFGTSKQPVLYILSYNWTFITPLVGKLISPSGSITLEASAVVQNEPY